MPRSKYMYGLSILNRNRTILYLATTCASDDSYHGRVEDENWEHFLTCLLGKIWRWKESRSTVIIKLLPNSQQTWYSNHTHQVNWIYHMTKVQNLNIQYLKIKPLNIPISFLILIMNTLVKNHLIYIKLV